MTYKSVTPGRAGWDTHEQALLANGWDVTDQGCWEYKGSRTIQGYGRITSKGVTVKAHRASYEAWVGGIPNGLVVLHSCDNPTCINPKHLSVGTHQDNADDMVRKGRSFKGTGEKHSQARLTSEQVAEIRAKYVPRKYTLAKLADEYGISFQHVSDIINRKKWR